MKLIAPNKLIAVAFSKASDGTAHLELVKSFGTEPGSVDDFPYTEDAPINIILDQLRNQARGFGFGQPADPPCSAAEMALYQVTIPRKMMLAVDNNGNQLFEAQGVNFQADFTIDLFDIQEATLRY